MKNSPRWLLPGFVDIGFCGEGWRRHQAAAPLSVPSIWVIYLVPSKQNDSVDFLMHMWKALGHTQKQHLCTHLLGHAQKTERKEVNGPSRWLFLQNSDYTNNFSKTGFSSDFFLILFSLQFGDLLLVFIRQVIVDQCPLAMHIC